MFPNYLEVEKTAFQLFRACQTLLQLFGEREKWIPAIWRLKNVVHNCQEQGKRLLHLFIVRKLVHSNQEHKINVSKLFVSGKNWFLAISRLTNTVAAIWRERKVDTCYLETKNVVHNCQEQGKRLLHLFKVRKTGSQQLGARQKCLPAIWKWKKVVPIYFEPDKHCCSYLEREKSGSQLFGD